MSRLNEDVLTPPGAMKGSLGKSTAQSMEPTTPQGPTKYSEFEAVLPSKSATDGVPGAVPMATPQGRTGREAKTELEEDPSYNQPYPHDIHHGEHISPNVKEHEAEDYEKVEAYAPPEKVKQHARESERPEEQERSTSSQETATAAQKQGLRASASGFVKNASTKATVARQYALGAGQRTKEVARGAAGVARVQLHRVVVVGKEKAGIPGEKPLLHAAKEKMGISPDQPVREAARQVTRQTVYSARERAYSLVAWFFNFVTTLPATIKELHSYGKHLVEERDRALAQQSQQSPENPPKLQQQGQQQQGEEGAQHGVSLPMPREHVNQSAAGMAKETHIEGDSGAQGAWKEQEHQFHEGGEGASGGGSQGGEGGQRRGFIGTNVAPNESERHSSEQGTRALQDKVEGDVVIDESGMHSMK